MFDKTLSQTLTKHIYKGLSNVCGELYLVNICQICLPNDVSLNVTGVLESNVWQTFWENILQMLCPYIFYIFFNTNIWDILGYNTIKLPFSEKEIYQNMR